MAVDPSRTAAGTQGLRLIGRLTADLILDSPQYMNPCKEYEIDLRGKLGLVKLPSPGSPANLQRMEAHSMRLSCDHCFLGGGPAPGRVWLSRAFTSRLHLGASAGLQPQAARVPGQRDLLALPSAGALVPWLNPSGTKAPPRSSQGTRSR